MIEASKSTDYKDKYLKALIEGDYKILNKIYQESAPSICRYIVSNGGTREQAKDIFQDALETILFKLKRRELKLTAPFPNYLFGVCRFLWLNRARKINRSALVNQEEINELYEAEEKQLSPQGEIVNTETAQAIQRWALLEDKILQLSADCQAIYGLTFQGERGEKIGEVLGKTVNHIRKIKSTCKQKLMSLVQKDARYAVLY